MFTRVARCPKLSYLGHALMENRNGLLVKTLVTEAKGTAERDAALLMAEKIPGVKRVTLGGDKNYDTKEKDLKGFPAQPCFRVPNLFRKSPETLFAQA